MVKKIIIGVMLIALTSIITACTMNESVESLMKPPRLSIKQEEVKAILEGVIDSHIKFTSPSAEKNMSAIQLVDITGDEQDEVVVFYFLENDQYPLRGLVLKNEAKVELFSGEIKGIGYDFDNVQFKDITGDGSLEIIVGFRGREFSNKGLSIYDYIDGEVVEIFKDSYTELAVGNLDKDQKVELVLIKSDREEGIAKAQFYKFNGEELKKLDESKMDAFTYYEFVKIGNATEDKTGVFINMSIGAHSGLTSLLVVEDGKINNVFFNEKNEFTEKTFTAYSIRCEDIDEDEIIEIPLTREPIGYEKSSYAETPWIHTWYKWDGDMGLTYVSESYNDYYANFSFDFPEIWDKNITIDRAERIRKDYEEYWVTFSYLDVNTSNRYPLLTIYSYDIDEWNKKQEEGDNNANKIVLDRSLKKVYVASTEENSSSIENVDEMKLDIEEVKELFKIIKR